jgi:hypothetical protein
VISGTWNSHDKKVSFPMKADLRTKFSFLQAAISGSHHGRRKPARTGSQRVSHIRRVCPHMHMFGVLLFRLSITATPPFSKICKAEFL